MLLRTEKFADGERAVGKRLQERNQCMNFPHRHDGNAIKSAQKPPVNGLSLLKRKAKAIAEIAVLTFKIAHIRELL